MQPRAHAPEDTLPPDIWQGCSWPQPADAKAARHLLEELHQTRAGSAGTLIAAIGGNSPYLADLIRKDPDDFAVLLTRGPADFVGAALHDVSTFDHTHPRHEVAACLRRTKNRVALACALADIGQLWTLEQVTGALSQLAQVALGLAVSHLLSAFHDRGQLRLKHPRTPLRGSGFVVLAMGKLGARELNYSSDIDLMILYDPDCHPDHDNIGHVFVRMARDLVTLMEAHDENGYVFRTDLRLRPDPSATPLAVSVPAAIFYYESLGQTWERAAMTKARAIAGDLRTGRNFLEAIQPFIWRKSLDFPVIDDIFAMKNRIDRKANAVAPAPDDAQDLTETVMMRNARAFLLGHDLKIGWGGIREIEFLAQSMQLVWGGRNPALRDPTTIGALKGLARAGALPRDLVRQLIEAYRVLRATEHRLQMRADQQTHRLPKTTTEFDDFARFMGEPDAAKGGPSFAAHLLEHMRIVRSAFEGHFIRPQDPTEHREIDLASDDLAEQLEHIGFLPEISVQAAEILRPWQAIGPRALRTERARALLRELLPLLLRAFARCREPLSCLRRFDTLLARQRAGVQVLSLLRRNPVLIERIATILDCSPFLADYLAETPSAFEGLIETGLEPGKSPEICALIKAQAGHQENTEQLVSALRGLVRAEEFRLSVARLEQRIDADIEGKARAAMADTVIAVLLKQVFREHVARYGRVSGGAIAVIALGKAGSRALMAGSDLDLMLVFDHAPDVTQSNAGRGARSLPVGQYFLRLTQAFITALTTPGTEGPFYAVDMRLRPSGSKGHVAVSLDSFMEYHAGSAWTWERMALTRARLVAGTQTLRRALRRAIDGMLSPDSEQSRARDNVLEDARHMRTRILRELPPSGDWDIKYRAGGLMEVEFIAQALQLTTTDPRNRDPTTGAALARLARVRALDADDAEFLIQADKFWRNLQSILRILFGNKPPLGLPHSHPAAVDMLCHETGCTNYGATLDKMNAISARVGTIFTRTIGSPAGQTSGPAEPE